MPIPDYQACFRPVLSLAAQQPITRALATEVLSEQFQLTPEERQQRIPSGAATYIRNRVGWAMTYLTKAGLIQKIQSKTYSITESGRDFLRRYPDHFGIHEMLAIPEFYAFQRSTRSGEGSASETGEVERAIPTGTPYERIDAALSEINANVRSQLLADLRQKPPDFFEQVVLDVLVAMGYGGSRENAAEHLGGVNDEGVDGRINQDPLGLDVILVQAKRYGEDNVIGREKLQQFIGAMHGQGATKGVFITTSRFAATAAEFVSRSSNLKVVLIDGEQLTKLMLRYRIGVRIERHADVLAIDNNYFDDESA